MTGVKFLQVLNQKKQMPARKFFKAELSRLRARVLKRGKAAAVSDQARHKLRIALKNLRYGVDFFGFVWQPQAKAGL